MSWVHAVIDVPTDAHARTAEFWGRALGWPAGAPWPTHPELQSFEPPSGAPYLHLQRIAGSPRVHLDVESDVAEVAVDQAIRLGAEFVAEQDRWRTLRSPGGDFRCSTRRTAQYARISTMGPMILPPRYAGLCTSALGTSVRAAAAGTSFAMSPA